MSSRRISKVNEAVRECVAMEILCKVRDPRVKNVTVLRAETAADMRTAKVYVSVMGDEKVQSLTMHGLRAASGYLQSQLADRLQTRYTPVLTFVLDPSVKRSIEASKLIRDALGESALSEHSGDETDEGLDSGPGGWDETEGGESKEGGESTDGEAGSAVVSVSEAAAGPVDPLEADEPGDREGAAGSARNTG